MLNNPPVISFSPPPLLRLRHTHNRRRRGCSFGGALKKAIGGAKLRFVVADVDCEALLYKEGGINGTVKGMVYLAGTQVVATQDPGNKGQTRVFEVQILGGSDGKGEALVFASGE